MSYFDGKASLTSWICTTITLIPKVAYASRVKDYRPISCCSVVYNIVVKILASRLQKVIPKLVSPTHAGFFPGRLIVDNVMMESELIRGCSFAQISPRCLVKVDIMKAYYSIDWFFLRRVMEEMSFPQMFIRWIMGCVSTDLYTILVNGCPTKKFKATKGLRQSDLLSSFLFTLAMEYVSRILKRVDKDGFEYHSRCQKVLFIEMMFANDLLIFMKGNVWSMHIIASKLDEFSDVFGLLFSRAKSVVFIGIPVQYLGIPLTARKLRYDECKVLIDKIIASITY